MLSRLYGVLLPFFACILLAYVPCAVAAPLTKERVVLYASVDQNGDSLTLSGKVREPEGVPAKGVVLLPHYTLTADKEAPSNKGTKEPQYIPEDYIVLMPDQIGFGATKDRTQLYLVGELTARNCVDMLLAENLPDSLPVYVAGYSQGAASAMWIIKLLEEQYADRVPLKQGFVGSGPYDVAAMYDIGVAQNYTTLPLSIPLLIEGMKVAYGLDLQTKDFYTRATERCYRKYIAGKKKGVMEIFIHMMNRKMTHWLSPQGMDKSLPQTQRLYSCFLHSSLVHYPVEGTVGTDTVCPSWQPRTPVYVFHSTTDDVVPFFNAEHVKRCFVSAPFTYDFDDHGTHIKSMPVFFNHVRDVLSGQAE